MHRFLFILISVLTAAILASGGYLIYKQQNTIRTYFQEIINAQKNYAKTKTAYDALKRQVKDSRKLIIIANDAASKNIKVSEIINTYASSASGDLSIYYKNLTTSESVQIDTDHKYYMASLYKVILVLYLLEQVKNGDASFSDRVGTSSATLDFAIDKIITESNNEFAQTLADKYGWKNIEKAMKEKLGISFSFGSSLQISAKNIGILFEEITNSLKLQDGESEYLLKLLNNQKKTNKLPKYLPKNIYSHNKTGEFENYSHDAGIFYTPRGNYILVFMSKTDDPAATNEQMAKMSKEIFDTINQANEELN
jgi:beta-lactamase class A